MFRVLFHNNCFDGACSASLFTRFHRECIGGVDDYRYTGLMHKAGVQFDDAQFDGAENAIVDFKYSNSPKVNWWFDHHQSAFMTEADRAQFEAGDKSKKFFDPLYTSCTGLIADVARERFGFDTAGLEDLLHWADIIDGAKFESAESAVGLAAPAMKLMTVIEATNDPTFIPRLIPLLTAQPLVETLRESFVQEALQPRLEKHHRDIELLRSRASVEDGVIRLTLRISRRRGIASSSRIGCCRRACTWWVFRSRASGRRSAWGRVRGRRFRLHRWRILRRFVSGMVVAGMLVWVRFRCRWIGRMRLCGLPLR